MNSQTKASSILLAVSVAFAGLAVWFAVGSTGRPAARNLSLVDTNFLDTSTVRRSYADLARAKEDLSDFDCYACHEKGKAPPMHYDTNQNVIVAKEHPDIVMGHGSHGRNNNCFNCHNETNLLALQSRDGRGLAISDSPQLCGSCHGPTYRDWEAGVHGRTSGYWDRSLGAIDRKQCVNCHNPHAPHFPGRKPAPGPHLLRSASADSVGTRSTTSPTLAMKNGTRWNASLPNEWSNAF